MIDQKIISCTVSARLRDELEENDIEDNAKKCMKLLLLHCTWSIQGLVTLEENDDA